MTENDRICKIDNIGHSQKQTDRHSLLMSFVPPGILANYCYFYLNEKVSIVIDYSVKNLCLSCIVVHEVRLCLALQVQLLTTDPNKYNRICQLRHLFFKCFYFFPNLHSMSQQGTDRQRVGDALQQLCFGCQLASRLGCDLMNNNISTDLI